MIQSAEAASMPAAVSATEAAAVMIEISKLMTELCEIVEAETDLVRAGRVAAAAKAAERKGELARAFMRNAARMHAGGGYLASAAPALLDALRRQHEHLCAKLHVNLTVLATARAVSEGILRGVSNQLAKRSTVQTYGASGRHHITAVHPAVPIAVSRSLNINRQIAAGCKDARSLNAVHRPGAKQSGSSQSAATGLRS